MNPVDLAVALPFIVSGVLVLLFGAVYNVIEWRKRKR